MPALDHTTSIEYRDIPGFPGYRVGSDGSIWSQRNRGQGGGWKPTNPWQKLNPAKDKGGYLRVALVSTPLKLSYVTVHTLVLKSFVGPRPPGMQCRHLNGVPDDNRPENLAWGTSKQNHADRAQHGTSPRGTLNGRATIEDAQVMEIRKLRDSGLCQREIAARHGVSSSIVNQIMTGRTWRHLIPESDRGRIKCGIAGRGERNGRAKLTEAQVMEIRKLRSSGLMLKAIGDAYGVSDSLISEIMRGKVWRHLLEDGA